jgi:DNA transformation protein
MAVSPSFRTFVEEQLADPARVTTRRMFGGLGIYWEVLFFALIDDDTLFFKVDDATRPSYEALGAKPFDPFKNGQVMRGYYEVPGEVLEDRAQLGEWRERAVGVARTAKRKQPKQPTKPKR